MSDELVFFIWLIEKYAYDKNLPTAQVMKTWKEKKIVQDIYDSYQVYHTERIENAYEDIENLEKTGKHLW